MKAADTEDGLEPAYALRVTTREALKSVNDLYKRGQGGRLVLSADGTTVKAKIKQDVAAAIMQDPAGWQSVIDLIYGEGFRVALLIDFYFPQTLNKSWKPGRMAKTPKGALRSPYKKMDTTNYLKLLEDAISEGTGIDDSAHVLVCAMKHEDQASPRVEINYLVVP